MSCRFWVGRRGPTATLAAPDATINSGRCWNGTRALWRGHPAHFYADSGSSAGHYPDAIAAEGWHYTVSYNQWTGPLKRTAQALPPWAWTRVGEEHHHALLRHQPEGRSAPQLFAAARRRDGLFDTFGFIACDESQSDAVRVGERHHLKGGKEQLFSEVLSGLDLHRLGLARSSSPTISQFLITNTISRPDGTTLKMQAHEYGPLILIYSHLEDFFPPADIGTAHEALRLLLWEKVDESKKAAAMLSPPSREKMDLLYKHDEHALASEMKQAISRHQAEMAPASPHGQLGALHLPVLLLHGAADNVIPPSEMLWLQQDIPSGLVKAALISPAFSHASMDGKPALADNLRLVHFMAQMLEQADKR